MPTYAVGGAGGVSSFPVLRFVSPRRLPCVVSIANHFPSVEPGHVVKVNRCKAAVRMCWYLCYWWYFRCSLLNLTFLPFFALATFRLYGWNDDKCSGTPDWKANWTRSSPSAGWCPPRWIRRWFPGCKTATGVLLQRICCPPWIWCFQGHYVPFVPGSMLGSMCALRCLFLVTNSCDQCFPPRNSFARTVPTEINVTVTHRLLHCNRECNSTSETVRPDAMLCLTAGNRSG